MIFLKSRRALLAEYKASVELCGTIHAAYAAKCKDIAEARQLAEAARINEMRAMELCHIYAARIQQLERQLRPFKAPRRRDAARHYLKLGAAPETAVITL